MSPTVRTLGWATIQAWAGLPLLSCILLLPWLLGGVLASAYLLLGVAVAFSLCLHLVLAWRLRRGVGSVPLLSCLLIIASLYALFQAAPIPSALTARLAPRSIEFIDQARAAHGVDRTASASASSISMLPAATHSQAVKLLIAASLVALSSRMPFFRLHMKWVLFAVALNGVLLAVFGVVQRLTWNGQIFWSYESPTDSSFASYVNRNNAGGYLVMCAVYVAGAWSYFRAVQGRVWNLPNQSFMQGVRNLINIDSRDLMAALAMTIMGAGILLTLSRGAFLGLTAATGLGAVVAYRHNRQQLSWAAVLILVGVCSLMVWCGLTSTVWDRLESLFDTEQLASLRVQHWRDDLRMLKDHWLVGVGIGSYEHANRIYQTVAPGRWFRYCENQYLETFIVAGVPGVGLLLVLVATAGYQVICSIQRHRSFSHLLGWIGAAVVLSQLVCACFDFGLYFASNMSLLALTCGALLCNDANEARGATRINRWSRVTNTFGWLILLLGMMAALPRLYGEFCVDAVARGIPALAASTWEDHRKLTVVDKEIAAMKRALKLVPANLVGNAKLSRLWIERSQIQLYDSLKAVSEASSATWQATSPDYLHARLAGLVGDAVGTAKIRDDEIVGNNLIPALSAARQAAQTCPFNSETSYRVALLEAVVEGMASSQLTLMGLANQWLPQSSSMHFRTSTFAFVRGEAEVGKRWLMRSIRLAEVPTAEHVNLAAAMLTPQDFVDCLPNANVEAFFKAVTASTLEASPPGYFRETVATAIHKLQEFPDSEFDLGERNYMTGVLQHRGQQLPPAIMSLERAVAANPANVGWRLRLVSLLDEVGEIEQALQHAKVCARARPEDLRIERLVRRLSRRISAHSSEGSS